MPSKKHKKNNYIEGVIEITKLIPKGRVTSYGAIADYLCLGSARMVGWALNNIKNEMEIPAHRVVSSKGELIGRNNFNPPKSMQQKLEKEGIEINNWKVKQYKKVFWHPSSLEEE